MSDTKNVKLGVCRVYYGGVDLGYTQGGVQVTVKTDTHKVNIDQFGKSTVNEVIMSRDVSAKVPLAETTLENLVRIMPGSTLNISGGSNATGKLTVVTAPSEGDTVTVSGKVFTFRAVPIAATDVLIGVSASASASNLQSALASDVTSVSRASYTVALGVVTVTYGLVGVAGNVFGLASGQASVTVVSMAGGVEPLSENVSVSNAVGISLLDIAQELRLHPMNKAITDKSEDFVIPLAATPGALDFAYEVEKERIYSTDFTGYPNADTGELFYVGDK
jgi:hypothetical protein